jgi:nucleolar protein 14
LVLTDKLDSDWKELFPVVNKLQKLENERQEPDEYDRLVKEMVFAPRGEPTEKLKNEEEVARLEKERLEKLERERLARMRGEENEVDKTPKHRSADDLDDGYLLEPVGDFGEDDKVLSYAIDGENEENLEESGEYLSAEEGNDEDPEASANGKDEESEGEESEEEESGSEEESEEDDLEDLKEDDESEEETPVDDPKVLKISTPDEKPKKEPKPQLQEPTMSKKTAEALEKIPYTIAMPDSYEHLQELLEEHPFKIQAIIVDRIIKTNHVKLMQVNRNKMLKLFAFLLQYINDGFSNVDSENIGKRFKLLNELSPLLYDLIQMNPEEGSKCFLEVVKEKYEDFKKNQKRFPPLESLVFFKLLGVLFPTSDFRHPVVTPSFVFLHHILSQAKVRSRSDVASGLFLATLVLDFQQLSKKFLPAVMNFLSGVCYLGVKKTMVDRLKPLLPFKKKDSLLMLEEKFKENFSEATKLSAEDFLDSPIDESFKVRALNVAVHLIADFVKLYDELVGLKYFLDPFESVLSRLVENEFLPKDLKKFIKSTLEDFQRIRLDKKFVYPQPERKIQPMIRLLEPRFETVLSDRRSMYSQHKGAKAEEQKLKHMVKREFKSAKRELRRDNEFLSKIRHKRRQDMDRDRVAKVKRIFNEASVQQSEYNALSRTKGRKGKF